jgi:hypothetical protein
MADIKDQLIKDSYNYVLQSDLSTGIVYRIGGAIPVNPIFSSGLTVNSGFTYSNGTEQPGYFLTTDGSGYSYWSPVSGTSTSGAYLPLSGGTVYGNTFYTSGLTASTLTVTGLTQTSGLTSTGGITFPQKTINSSYTVTDSDYMVDITGGTFNVQLTTAVGVQGRLLAIKNNGGGAVTIYPYGSEKIDDKDLLILSETNAVQLVSNGSQWVILGQDRSTVNNSTGVFQFSGLTKVSNTQFAVARVRGWIVDDTSNPLSPQIYYVDYSGGTHTDNYVTTDFETFVYLTSGGTISQQPTPLTEQQRRQNIFLGKIGHPQKTSINLVFSQPDFVLSPLAQLRDIFAPINLINGGVYPSVNGANLTFNTSAGFLYGLGINFASDTLAPNALNVPGQSPCTFQYRTSTGGTVTDVTNIDPTKWDVNGVVTNITGTKATNQRVYLLQNGTFRIQYGQTEYNQLSAAISGIQTETFTVFPNFTNNAVLIGILSVLSTCTDLSDTSKAQFFLVSKFGETVGAAGGIGTTTLQQAYNNSSEPEITINSTLDGVSIKNGTGNLDNVSSLLQGLNAAGTVTSFIRADGLFSGSSISTPILSGNSTQLIVSGNNSSDLVRITQTGSGNAIVVEDSVNPDSTPFVVDASGRVGIGTTSPQYFLVASSSTATDTVMFFDGGTAANSNLVAAADTTIKLPVVVLTDRNNAYGVSTSYYIALDRASSPLFAGRNDAIYVNNYQDKGHYFITNSGGTKATRMSIFPTGNVGIGTTTDANYKLDISGSARSTNFRLTDNTLIATQYSVGSTTLTISNGGHNNAVGVKSTSAVGVHAISSLGVSVNNVLGASVYAAGGAQSGNISLGLLSNRALVTSAATGMGMQTSAMLQVDSTTQGFLPPRMTNAQRTSISTPVAGLMVYCTDFPEGLFIYKSTGWVQMI